VSELPGPSFENPSLFNSPAEAVAYYSSGLEQGLAEHQGALQGYVDGYHNTFRDEWHDPGAQDIDGALASARPMVRAFLDGAKHNLYQHIRTVATEAENNLTPDTHTVLGNVQRIIGSADGKKSPGRISLIKVAIAGEMAGHESDQYLRMAIDGRLMDRALALHAKLTLPVHITQIPEMLEWASDEKAKLAIRTILDASTLDIAEKQAQPPRLYPDILDRTYPESASSPLAWDALRAAFDKQVLESAQKYTRILRPEDDIVLDMLANASNGAVAIVLGRKLGASEQGIDPDAEVMSIISEVVSLDHKLNWLQRADPGAIRRVIEIVRTRREQARQLLPPGERDQIDLARVDFDTYRHFKSLDEQSVATNRDNPISPEDKKRHIEDHKIIWALFRHNPRRNRLTF